MKNLTKIFMAVMAGMLAFSCVTDITEDQAVQLGADQTTTIGLSLESDVRTHITGKEGEEYPMYWSENDKIAVNGKTSNALDKAYHGQQQALFTVNAVLDYPRAIVYPAPAEGIEAVAEDCQVVTFPALQAYTAGTFAEGSVPMYGYVADENAATTLNHLAGVLRIPVMCAEGVESTLLKAMVVEVNHGSIAGNFDINCATGKLTAHADALNTVTVTFGEGLALTNEATPVYVAVPAGEYGTVSITLYTDNSSYTARFSTFFDKVNDKMVKAGTVREFSTPIVYIPGESSDTFLIYDEASLRNFASRVNAAEENFDTTYPNAKVVANIDLTGKEWTPIEGYAGSIDGLNHKIIGLTAPLFGTTKAASIKNLHLVDVDITASGSIVGPMACLINNEAAVIENCSTSGKLHIVGKAEDAIIEGDALQYGGFIGYSNSTKIFTNITSDVDVTATGQFSVAIHLCGFAGAAKSGLENATNLGTVTFSGKMLNSASIYLHGFASVAGKGLKNCVNGSANDNNAGALTVTKDATCANIIMAGLEQVGCTKLENCINYGDIKNEANGVTVLLAGICRWAESEPTFTNVINRGDITMSGSSSNETYCGGIIASSRKSQASSFVNCHNYGAILFEESYTKTSNSGTVYIGGISAINNTSNVVMAYDGCNNYGSITFKGKIEGQTSSPLFVGGLIGALTGTDQLQGGCTNYGTINVGGSIAGNRVFIGGCMGTYKTAATGSGNITNKGNINCSITSTHSDASFDEIVIGGWAGSMNIDWSGGVFRILNSGNITCTSSDTDTNTIAIGGIVGSLSNSLFIGNARCFCDIEAKNVAKVGMLLGINHYLSAGNTRKCQLGGTIWKKDMEQAEELDASDYINYIHATPYDWPEGSNYDRCGYISSFEAAPVSAMAPFKIDSPEKLKEFGTNIKTISKNVVLTADINMTDEEWTPITGNINGGTLDGQGHKIKGLTKPLFKDSDINIKNLHLVDINMEYYGEQTQEIAGATFNVMGALICRQNDLYSTIENCSVSGNININGNNSSPLLLGGIVGYSGSTITYSKLENKANIKITGAVSQSIYLAGCVAYSDGALDSCQNLGNITFEPSSAAGRFYFAGISYHCKNVINCTNGSDKKDELDKFGNITVKALGANGAFCGIVHTSEKGKVTNCKNYGKFAIAGTQASKANVIIAGITSVSNGGTIKNCTNYGTIEASTKTLTSNMFIGGISCGTDGANLYDCSNYGNITYTKDASSGNMLYIGGIANTSGIYTYHNLHNYGEVAVHGEFANGVHLGGIIGRLNSFGEFSGDIINEGVIRIGANTSVTGSGKSAYVGGLFGGCNTAVRDITGDNIYSRGPIIVEEGAAATNGIYVGGVIGSLAEATNHNPKIIGVKSACQIRAIGRSNVGMIIGTNRDTENPKVKDCRIAGKFDTEYVFEDIVTNWWESIALDANNYQDYIYSKEAGETTNWSGAIRYDGNIFDNTLEHVEITE